MRSKIPGFSKVLSALDQMLNKDEVAHHWIQDMLPRANSIRIADPNPLFADKGAHQIRHQSVAGPVASTDDVARARRRNLRPFRRTVVAAPICSSHDLGACLAAAVRIVPSHGIS